jgi:hypothetical protein
MAQWAPPSLPVLVPCNSITQLRYRMQCACNHVPFDLNAQGKFSDSHVKIVSVISGSWVSNNAGIFPGYAISFRITWTDLFTCLTIIFVHFFLWCVSKALNQHNLYNFNKMSLIIIISLPPIQFTSSNFREYPIQ